MTVTASWQVRNSHVHLAAPRSWLAPAAVSFMTLAGLGRARCMAGARPKSSTAPRQTAVSAAATLASIVSVIQYGRAPGGIAADSSRLPADDTAMAPR